MPNFIPHTQSETRAMLEDLGLESLEEIFATIPSKLRLGRDLALAPGVSEFDILSRFEETAAKNLYQGKPLISFAGGGAYDHDIPAAVKALGSRSEFVTAYTPYQPEVAQGVLQALFEFQTLVSRLSGLEVSNASLYDGATALVEAVNLASAFTRSFHIVMSGGVNPSYRETVATFAKGTSVEIETLGLKGNLTTSTEDVAVASAAAVIVGYPNFFGAIEDLSAMRELADSLGALLIVVYDPISMGILRSPGGYGADVVVGEGQSLGIPLSFGGPYLGLFSAKADYLRLVPGRLVGETVDVAGRTAYVTTLRTREQDIRREKASSNVCTNQTLMAVQAAIFLSWLGKRGLVEFTKASMSATHYLATELQKIEGVTLLTKEFVREFTISIPQSAKVVLGALADRGFLGGVAVPKSLGASSEQGEIVMTATEKRTKAEIDSFTQAFREVLGR